MDVARPPDASPPTPAPPPAPEPIRAGRREKFAAFLPPAAAAELEQACYNSALILASATPRPVLRSWQDPTFVAIYATRCGTLLRLLQQKDSPLLRRLQAGELSPRQAGGLFEQQLAPEGFALATEDVERRRNIKATETYYELFECGQCRQRKHRMVVAQLRSADEGSTFICTCVCGHTFHG